MIRLGDRRAFRGLTVAGLSLVASAMPACSDQPSRRTSAVIVNIAPGSHAKYEADKALVTARNPQGLVTSRNVPMSELDCRVGDTVGATAQGLTLTLDPGACRRRHRDTLP